MTYVVQGGIHNYTPRYCPTHLTHVWSALAYYEVRCLTYAFACEQVAEIAVKEIEWLAHGLPDL
jgi:hypothetical protein